MLSAHNMIETIDSILTTCCDYLWSYVLIFALLGTHLYLTFILRAPQRHILTAMKYYFPKKEEGSGQISQFSSLMVSLAANVGTGNIVGVAVALATGGPGAIFWCMLTGVLGMSTRYAESLLAIRYRVQDKNGNISGGPMYAIERGMKCKWLAVIFAILTAIAAFGIGNITQANAVAKVLSESAVGVPTWLTGAILTILVAGVLLCGLKGISRVCSALVPSMAIIYVLGCGILLAVNVEHILPAIGLIIKSAFTTQAASGGFIGSCIIIAMQQGVRRGLFSNEAGMGSSPIVSAPVQTPNPVQQALVSSTGPFWDTVVICSLTGITLTTVVLSNASVGNANGELLTHAAFNSIGVVGEIMLTLSLASFVISTLLGWSYFGEKSLEYLGGHKLITPYRMLWVIAVFVGCVIPKSAIVWNFADIANGLMAIPNLICLVWLSRVLIKDTRYYLWQKRLDEKDETAIPVVEEKN